MRKRTINGSEKVSDWNEIDDNDNIRSLNKDGLTTIVPIGNNNLSHENIDWIQTSLLTSIKSYFKSFENNSLILTLKDEINKKELIINNANYKEIYQSTLNKIEGEELNPLFFHNILVSKPYILNKDLIDTKEISLSVSLKTPPQMKQKNLAEL